MKKIVIAGVLFILATVGLALYIHEARTIRLSELSPEDKSYLEANDYFQGSNSKSKDVRHALELWTKLAEAGHVPSQCFLGYVYQKGQDFYNGESKEIEIEVKVDEDKAWHWASLAAENGCSLAVYQLGMWYKNAEETEENRLKAIYWLKLMAERDNYDYAQYHLGLLYLDDKADEAKYWLTRAANQGHKEAAEELMKIDPDYQPPKYSDTEERPSEMLNLSPDFAAIFLINLLGKSKS